MQAFKQAFSPHVIESQIQDSFSLLERRSCLWQIPISQSSLVLDILLPVYPQLQKPSPVFHMGSP